MDNQRSSYSINTVSGNVDGRLARQSVTSMQPPSYDLALKTAINHDEVAPPSYDSLYYKFKGARRNLRQTMQNNSFVVDQQNNKSIKEKLFKAAVILLASVFFIFLPVLNIVVGFRYKDECAINSSIPLWLIIDGLFVILLGFSIFLFKYFDCSLFTSVLGLFLFSWLIRGSIWIFKVRTTVVYSPPASTSYCNQICYLLAFWTITVSWTTIGLFLLILIVSVCMHDMSSTSSTTSHARDRVETL